MANEAVDAGRDKRRGEVDAALRMTVPAENDERMQCQSHRGQQQEPGKKLSCSKRLKSPRFEVEEKKPQD